MAWRQVGPRVCVCVCAMWWQGEHPADVGCCDACRFLVLCFAKDLAALAKGCLFPDLWSRAEPTTLRTRSLSGAWSLSCVGFFTASIINVGALTLSRRWLLNADAGRVPDEAKASDEGSGEGASSQAGRVPSHDDTRGPALSLPSVPHNLTQSPEREFRFTFLLAFPLLGWTTKQVCGCLWMSVDACAWEGEECPVRSTEVANLTQCLLTFAQVVDALLATLTTTPTRMDASRACVEVLLVGPRCVFQGNMYVL